MKNEQKGVRLDHITKLYKDYKTGKEFAAVDDVSVNITPGNFITLLGPSGCGKTTVLRMIAGFESPDSGEIYLGSQAINELTPNKRDTAMVFQSYALLPHYNVFNNIAYGLNIRKIPKNEIKERVMDMLKLVELEGLELRMTNQLSGGQQQRVALARALIVEPSVLLFDEPLSNLDAKLRITMRTEIRRMQQTVGTTAIYVTHDQAEAMSIADQIIVMNKGKIAQIGTPREIYYQPKNEFVADFIGEVNFLEGKVTSITNNIAHIDVNGVDITTESFEAITIGNQCKVILRPESISLQEKGILPCKVILSTFMGAYQYYQVDVNGKMIKITDYNPKQHKLYNVGEKAFLYFKSNNLHVI